MICVGIDVAKDKHDCFILSSEGEVLAEVQLPVSGKWVRASARKHAFGSRLGQAKCSACPTHGWVKRLPQPCKPRRRRCSLYCEKM